MKKVTIILIVILPLYSKGQTRQPQQVVSDLYDFINYDGTNMPDFAASLALFTNNAQMKWVSDTAVMAFTPPEFFNVIESQIQNGILLSASEQEISNQSEIFGKIAHFFSSYSTKIQTPQGKIERSGINSIQLIQQNEDWRITSIIWYDQNDQYNLPSLLSEEKKDDRKSVKRAAQNYIESIYKSDTTLLKSVSKNLNKEGYYLSRKDSSWTLSPMTYEELKYTSASYNQKKWIPENAPKDIQILDIDERIANVKVHAIWGFDYLLMTKSDEGEWKIQKILWQSYTFPEHRKMVEKIKNQG